MVLQVAMTATVASAKNQLSEGQWAQAGGIRRVRTAATMPPHAVTMRHTVVMRWCAWSDGTTPVAAGSGRLSGFLSKVIREPQSQQRQPAGAMPVRSRRADDLIKPL